MSAPSIAVEAYPTTLFAGVWSMLSVNADAPTAETAAAVATAATTSLVRMPSSFLSGPSGYPSFDGEPEMVLPGGSTAATGDLRNSPRKIRYFSSAALG